MAQLPEGNGRPFLLWQTAQLFDAPAEYDSAQAYPAEIMKPAGYILETPPTTHDNPLTTVSRPVPISVPPFKVDLKPPRFDVQWRWWEDEASFILRAFAVESIKRLVQFRLYHDDNLPRSILRSRDANTVTAFLNSLLSPNDGTVVTELTHYDRVEKLLSLCRSKDNEARPWSWFPTSTPNEICYEAVARDINDESYLQFKAVRFEDWAHYSLGYPTPSVEWFLMQHSQLSSYLMAHFNEFPDQAYKYVEVEKRLRSGNPFAHQAVLCTLKAKRILEFDDSPLSAHRLMRFLTIPIQNLFTTQQNGLIRMLKKLVVLEVRFNQIYHRGSDVKWDSYFEAESPLLDEFFEASSPRALARSLTHSDDRDFTGLCLQSFVTEDSIFRRLTANWDNLCTVTEECCLAYPDLIDYFKSCVQKANPQRFSFNLLFPATGATSQDFVGFPSNFFDLLDAANNYASYRKILQNRPGLPFLRPHAIEYQSYGELGLVGLFPLPDL
ncbi:hypothetical protein BDBG_00777 [Blastomyces gilchristii SLH14081]|uniref:Ras-GEF domain-containing protein n=1 Tax=Blastomyces gilchristii (strain SLH14081) TaxID=559298 RepID=A0A179U8V5_BLAGS|nr:uncharacterized protein BDBG_00777 [Blastomyces gilchristii SLH14081]OAT04163.1 hypothetical protein BDBG_00777 [Blastomyces gilchristii SLH14081]